MILTPLNIFRMCISHLKIRIILNEVAVSYNKVTGVNRYTILMSVLRVTGVNRYT